MSKPRRQEQESANSEVTEAAPGVLRMELPISMPGLGHVNCYALIDSEGAAIVDPGLPGPSSWRALTDRLKQAGLSPRHVHTVIITHSHPDHFGGAMRFAKEAGSKIVAHRSFAFGPVPTPAEEEPEVSVDDMTAHQEQREQDAEPLDERLAPPAANRPEMPVRWSGKTPWGGERPKPPLKTRLRWRMLRMLSRGSFVPEISDMVDHEDVLRLAGRDWFVLHTPGHTSDHVCLHDPAEGIFLAGDHVLPTITPHISGISSAPDPLNQFFYSLDRVGEISHVKRALPAHGNPFDDLHGRTEAIKRHHYERLDQIKDISRELGPATVEQFSQKLFKQRSWGPMAESETFAHLEHLRIGGEAERRDDSDGCYVYVL